MVEVSDSQWYNVVILETWMKSIPMFECSDSQWFNVVILNVGVLITLNIVLTLVIIIICWM